MGLLFVSTQPIYAQESPAFEKIRDVSPDGKFALRILCSSEPDNPNDIDSNLITAIDLVSLPSKKVIAKISEEGTPPHLIWSPDLKWFAFPFSESHRVTETHVYHRSGDEFTRLETESFKCLPKDSQLRWLKKDIVTIDGRKWADWRYVPMLKGTKDYSHSPVYTRFLTTSYKGQLLGSHLPRT